ncbi:MAG: sulfotransferase domain-containing protein [Terriglobales bacterium]
MISRLLAGTKRAFGMHRPGRNLAVLPDDVFIVSYPKSGNTWSRFLVANLLNPEEPANFANINGLIPDPEALSVRELARLSRPRILKSHQYFDPRYPKVIYIVRDPRDVVLSQYHFQIKRRVLNDDHPLEPFVTSFIAGLTSPYGSWGENAGSWLAARYDKHGLLLVRYEDLIADAISEMKRIAVFLEITVTSQLLAQAVERSSAGQMRKLEADQAHMWSSTKDTRKDVPFVRAAGAGGWKSKLPEKSVLEIENAWSPLMKWLGYDLLSQATPEARSVGIPEPIFGGSLK